VNLLIVLMTIQTALLRSDAYLLDAALQPRARVIISAVAGLLALGIGLALAPSLGMVGVCVGLIAGRAVQSIAYPVLVSGSLGADQRPQWRSLVRPTLASLLLLGTAAVLGERVLAPSWIAFAGVVALSFALLVPVTALAGLTGADRQQLITRVRGIWRGVHHA
jgi:O-antigen/teichoic acid export membrane protein